MINRNINILLAEDDPDDQLMTRRALKDNRVLNQLYVVENGQELLDFLHHRGAYSDSTQAPRPGLILLDLNMPRMDGREALQEIKCDPGLRRIPIIALTTSKTEEDIMRSYELGANSYITKPVTLQEFTDVLRIISDYWLKIVALPEDQQPDGQTAAPVPDQR